MAKDTKDSSALYKILDEKFNAYFEPELIKTGIIPLDLVLNGGIETGSLISLSGESQTGKSTLLMNLAKNFAEKGYKTVYIDAEGSVKEDQLAGIGLLPYLSTRENKDNMFTLVKESGYRAVEELIDTFLKYGDYKLFIIDSLSSLTLDIYLDEKEDRVATEDRVGVDALQNARLLKKLSAIKTKYNCIFIFINQTRVNMSGYVTKYEPTGGQAVKFYPDCSLFMNRKDELCDKRDLLTGTQEVPIGANTFIKATKSRLGLSKIPYPMTVYFGKGVSNLASYESLLPNLTLDDGTTILNKVSSVSYVLTLPSGEYKTSKGHNGLLELLVEHYDEIEKIVDVKLSAYFEKLKAGDTSDMSQIAESVTANPITPDSDDDDLDEAPLEIEPIE